MLTLITFLALWGMTSATLTEVRKGGDPLWVSLFSSLAFCNAVLLAALLWDLA